MTNVQGKWLLLQNGHLAPGLLGRLETLMAEAESVDADYRCWILAEASSQLPVCLLQNSYKIMVDTAKVRDTLDSFMIQC